MAVPQPCTAVPVVLQQPAAPAVGVVQQEPSLPTADRTHKHNLRTDDALKEQYGGGGAECSYFPRISFAGAAEAYFSLSSYSSSL